MFPYMFIVLLTHNNNFVIVNLAWGQFWCGFFLSDRTHKKYKRQTFRPQMGALFSFLERPGSFTPRNSLTHKSFRMFTLSFSNINKQRKKRKKKKKKYNLYFLCVLSLKKKSASKLTPCQINYYKIKSLVC